ncbi:hypothetical protein CF392_08225 [Tamilnaduibacter salinus]|uniref:DUF4124 domain-containing protein n=1 Tax=Tamilnaduibacter salinus TaxID=1484056 RepID=A0A2A2I2Z1_9GAMM|nr:DUF4124 domain-containing protein [Tamilnaduibacter salinus]PAV25952.1 hypothetical protein CF392_08225 [Tamilnaduibacter salinus]
MHRTIMLAVTLAASPMPLAADVYQCTRDGVATFSDQPCGGVSEPVDITTTRVGGRLDTGTDIDTYQPETVSDPETGQTGCPAGYIQSTRLRHLRVKERVQTGMSAGQVRYILGAPHHRDGQWWVYEDRGRETGRYKIQNGCLERIG